MAEITIMLNGNRVRVDKDEYLNLKLKDVQESFSSVTRDTLEHILDDLLEEKSFVRHAIIAEFVRDDRPQPVPKQERPAHCAQTEGPCVCSAYQVENYGCKR